MEKANKTENSPLTFWQHERRGRKLFLDPGETNDDATRSLYALDNPHLFCLKMDFSVPKHKSFGHVFEINSRRFKKLVKLVLTSVSAREKAFFKTYFSRQPPPYFGF